jgi:hypothetical protein
MAIEPKFNQQDIHARFEKFRKVIDKRIIQRLQYLGELCVIHARSIPASSGFMDQTGNLRSSIGYVVFKDGVAIHDNYTGTGEGVESGKSLAEKVGSKRTMGYSLVVTAGMSYAVYVEATGRDVLTSAEILAKQQLPKMLNELKQNINKAID